MQPGDSLGERAKGRRDRIEFHLFQRDWIIRSWLVQQVVRAKEAEVERLTSLSHQHTKWSETTCAAHGGDSFVSKLLPGGPQRRGEVVDIGDTSGAHGVIEKGSIEGDASIERVVGSLERQGFGKDVAGDGSWDQGDRGQYGRLWRRWRRLLWRHLRKVEDGVGERVGGSKERELVELFSRYIGRPRSEHAHRSLLGWVSLAAAPRSG